MARKKVTIYALVENGHFETLPERYVHHILSFHTAYNLTGARLSQEALFPFVFHKKAKDPKAIQHHSDHALHHML